MCVFACVHVYDSVCMCLCQCACTRVCVYVNIYIDIDICIKIYMHSGKTGNTSVSMKMYGIEKHMVFGVLSYSLNYLQTLNGF